MKVLVLGATGATGSKVVARLLENNIPTRILVRSTNKILPTLVSNPLLEVITGSIYNISSTEADQITQDCNFIVCCLGHNVSLKGIFGKPHLLVYTSLRKICESSLKNPKAPSKIILMNTTGYHNKSQGENRKNLESFILKLLEHILPPQKDNIFAANYLWNTHSNNPNLEWVIVRPDSLTKDPEVSPYEVIPETTTDAIFKPGSTSRTNVSHFMVELILKPILWDQWKYKMPVIYNLSKEGS
jgi:hypothetical protein